MNVKDEINFEDAATLLEGKCKVVEQRLKYYRRLERASSLLSLSIFLLLFPTIAASVEITIVMKHTQAHYEISFNLGQILLIIVISLLIYGAYCYIDSWRKVKRYGTPSVEDFLFPDVYKAYKNVENFIQHRLDSFADEAVDCLESALKNIDVHWHTGSSAVVWNLLGEKIEDMLVSLKDRIIPAIKRRNDAELRAARNALLLLSLFLAEAHNEHDVSWWLGLFDKIDQCLSKLSVEERIPAITKILRYLKMAAPYLLSIFVIIPMAAAIIFVCRSIGLPDQIAIAITLTVVGITSEWIRRIIERKLGTPKTGT